MAGVLLLLIIAIHSLLHPELPLRQPGGHLGVVPLGTPLIVGPAVLTTLLTLARSHGYTLTLLAFSLNLVLVWVALRWAFTIVQAIGEAGAQAMAKVFGWLLAAIGLGCSAGLVAQPWTSNDARPTPARTYRCLAVPEPTWCGPTALDGPANGAACKSPFLARLGHIP